MSGWSHCPISPSEYLPYGDGHPASATGRRFALVAPVGELSITPCCAPFDRPNHCPLFEEETKRALPPPGERRPPGADSFDAAALAARLAAWPIDENVRATGTCRPCQLRVCVGEFRSSCDDDPLAYRYGPTVARLNTQRALRSGSRCVRCGGCPSRRSRAAVDPSDQSLALAAPPIRSSARHPPFATN